MGVGLASAVQLMAPDIILLGGGLVEAMESLFLEEVQRAVKEHAMPHLRKDVKIVATHLGDDVVALGGAYMISKRLAKH